MMQNNADLITPSSMTQYVQSLVGRFYKILPLCESGSVTLDKYMNSLLRELLGCEQLSPSLRQDDRYTSLLAILRFLIDNHHDLAIVRADVFRAINIISQLKQKYMEV